MFNKKNILGWTNLALRLLLSFGLIFIVSRFIGNDSVSLWLVYITIIATVNAIDGLLSQFFVREIISSTWGNNEGRICPFFNQHALYSVLGLCIYFIGYFTLRIKGIYLSYVSVLLSIYFVTRVYDSRLKAFIDAGLVQKIEITLNMFLMLLVAIAIYATKNISVFIIIHLIGLILLSIFKWSIVSKSEGNNIYRSKSNYFLKKFRLDREITKTIIISFGSSLSINLSLIAMEALIPGGISTNYLFTYRVGALICEIISIPVIIRIPELTKLIASDNKKEAKRSFLRNYKQSIFACLAIMTVVFSMQGVWNDLVPEKLNLVNKIILVNIFGGWLFERVATLLSQFYLSSKSYLIYKNYVFYAISVTISVLVSIVANNEYIFSYAIVLINIVLAIIITRRWRLIYAD